MKELCLILIYHQNKQDIFKAILSGLGKWKDFNPLYILPDIFANNGKLKFSNYDFSSTISLTDVLYFNDEERTQYQAVLDGITFLMHQSSETQSAISSELIEILRPYYDITFKFTPLADVTLSSSSYPIHYSSFSIEEVIEKKSSLYYDYCYQCYSPADILFSIMHFIALKQYKFRRCDHCGKYFVTNNLKRQYCNRFSEYPSYEKYTCYDAVKRIRQDIQRKHIRIGDNLRRHYPIEKLNDFEMQFNELVTKLKKHSEYSIIKECFDFLDTEKWYGKDCIRNVGWKEKINSNNTIEELTKKSQ